MSDTDLISQSASTLAEGIRQKRFSSSEVVGAHLARIERVNPRIHAVIQLTADAARAGAQAADEAVVRGDDLGPLHGVPFTVKDWIEVAGVVCASGFEERRDHVPKRDATVVVRMRAAGAILLGKTNVAEGRPLHDPPANPYDLRRTPGSSSSGEAAIIAAAGSPLGLASDSGGSIRWPAHCCGVAGLKPTTGRVPLTGHFPRITALVDSRTQIGPMARSVDDLALALRIISGPDFRDSSVIPMPLGDHRDVDLRSLRIAWYAEMPGAAPTAETVDTVRRVAAALAETGAAVEEVLPPRIEESLDITRGYWKRVESMSQSEWMPPRSSTQTADQIEQSIFEWDRFRRTMIWFMERFDVIVCPAAEAPAGLPGNIREQDYIYTLPYSLTGQPAAVIRAGTSNDGMPIGIQVIARPWCDDVALAVATHIETAFGGWQPPSL